MTNIKKTEPIKNTKDLRDMLSYFWERKLLLISVSVIAAILGAVISLFIVSPVYRSRFIMEISIPSSYVTIYGKYNIDLKPEQFSMLIKNDLVLSNTLKELNLEENLTLAELKDNITVRKANAEAGFSENSFVVNVSSSHPDRSKDIAYSLFRNYLDYVDLLVNENAVDYYTNIFITDIVASEISLKTEREALKSNEDLLADTDMFLDIKGSEIQVEGQSNYLIDIMNPVYTKLQHDILGSKQYINMLNNKIKANEQYLEALDAERSIINKYKETGVIEGDTKIIEGISDNILMLNQAEPGARLKPNHLKDIVLSVALADILVLTIIYIKYWTSRGRRSF